MYEYSCRRRVTGFGKCTVTEVVVFLFCHVTWELSKYKNIYIYVPL